MGEVRLLYKKIFVLYMISLLHNLLRIIPRFWKKTDQKEQRVRLRQQPAPAGGLLRVNAVLSGGTSYLWAPANLQNSSPRCWGAEDRSSVQI